MTNTHYEIAWRVRNLETIVNGGIVQLTEFEVALAQLLIALAKAVDPK